MMQINNSHKVRSKLIQVFRYLQALNQIRNPIQREIQDQPWIMWFHDLPNHPSIRRGLVLEADNIDEGDAVAADNFILKASRPKLNDPPDPPKEIVLWLQDGWKQIDSKIVVEASMPSGSGDQIRIINFNDDPQRQLLLEEWILRRDRWVESEKPARAAYDVFDKLYALQNQIERESERLELILGDGLFRWQTRDGLHIYHPVLLLRLQLKFNPDIPEFTLVETGQSSELYTAIFQGLFDIKAAEVARCREDHEQGNLHPLGGEETGRFMKRLINRLFP
ncbi:MAG TPA: hypothetical protein VKP04_00170, partial [Ktedonobacteraceae bacterium]|nr:hypothetical protein [Ktedonobacteraceae bacterium]